MDSAYVEMKPPLEMKGSINSVISHAHGRLGGNRRPPALSESFAWEPENVERAKNLSSNTLDLLVEASPQTSPQTTPPPPKTSSRPSCESRAFNITLRFLFHITLISIFESVFFFLYVSMLEDNGIQHTVGGFVQDAVAICSNLTVPEQQITNDVLSLFINASAIEAAGTEAFQTRTVLNKALFNKSWIYVGGLGALFLLLTGAAYARKVKIKWKKLILENIGLVLMLAAYEYTFFSTIIFPYNPITGAEIAQNAVLELQDRCHIL
jgi:hypothetical protein